MLTSNRDTFTRVSGAFKSQAEAFPVPKLTNSASFWLYSKDKAHYALWTLG